jgi:hypothetical protein
MADEYTEILERAMALVQERKPDASAQKHAAFANSVAYVVTGMSGGYGGPSVREHAVGHTITGRMSFDGAVELLIKDDGLIFGPLTDLHRLCWQDEHCFDDDPEDVAALEQLN